MSRRRGKRSSPVRIFDPPTDGDRRTGWYVVPQGGRLFLVHADQRGAYEDGEELAENNPWHWIAARLLSFGGDFMEVPHNDLDGRLLGESLKQTAYLLPGDRAIKRPVLTGKGWHCYENAVKLLARQGPDSQLVVGLAMHMASGWVLHTWVQSLTHGVMEATSVPLWYYGIAVPRGKKGQDMRSWWRQALMPDTDTDRETINA